MLKDDLPPREPARDKATRKWRNKDIQRRQKEEKAIAELAPQEPKELEVGDVIKNEKVVAEAVTKFQTKFAQEIKAMLDHHTTRNILLYKLSIRHQLRRLKLEKLRRLEAKAAQQAQDTSNV